MKKKIAIIISGNGMVRNYLSTNTFKNLNKKFDILYIVDGSNVSSFKYFTNNKLNFQRFFYTKKDLQKYNNFHLLNTYLSENKSKSIKYSIQRILRHQLFYPDQFLKNILMLPFRFISKIKKNFIYHFYKNIYSEYKSLSFDNKINSKLENIILKFKPNLIVCPTAGQSISYYDSVRIGKKLGVKSLAIIDNWDNMSSRTHPKPHADHYAVWGKQSKKHGQYIQSIKKKNISIVGSARFEEYFKLRDKDLKNNFKFKYAILFEGFGIEEDLEMIMDKLEKVIHTNKIKNFKIIYRPHPWRKNIKRINLKKYKNIILDPQFKKAYYENNFRTTFQPDLSYYPSLINNSEFVISAPTTMVIESLIFRKKIIILAHGRKKFLGHYNHNIKLTHIDGINKIKNIFVYKDGVNLEKLFLKLYNKNSFIGKREKKMIDKSRDYFLYKEKKSFKLLIQKIFIKMTKN